jgi:hypothetical protein
MEVRGNFPASVGVIAKETLKTTFKGFEENLNPSVHQRPNDMGFTSTGGSF